MVLLSSTLRTCLRHRTQRQSLRGWAVRGHVGSRERALARHQVFQDTSAWTAQPPGLQNHQQHTSVLNKLPSSWYFVTATRTDENEYHLQSPRKEKRKEGRRKKHRYTFSKVTFIELIDWKLYNTDGNRSTWLATRAAFHWLEEST